MIGSNLGPYKIERELGSGGMGKVYAATVAEPQPGLAVGDLVALKVVHAHLLETRGFFKRFLREAEIGKQVKHPNVVRTFDADALAHGGVQQNFLVMEYVEGQTLRDLLEELDRVPEELCRHIGREVAKGLVAIHAAGVVHRDLKPENVLITPDHEVKVMDLGVARLTDEIIRLSQSGAFVGSVLYAAPEQFSGGGQGIDSRADLYALGLTLYELTTGQHPFADEDLRAAMRRQIEQEPRPPAEINPQLSPFMEEVIRNLLAKDREERFASATEVLATLVEGEECDWWQERSKALRIETSQPLRRVRIPRETALYGRDDELARLQSAWDRVKAGDGQVVLVEGEDGIGKTRLVDDFVGRLRQSGEDLNFLFGSYPPGGGTATTGAFSTAYREHFGDAGLEDTLQRYMTITPALVPAFSALLVGDATPAGSEPLTSDSLQTVFVHCTRALAAERPTIVLIDDLHFAAEGGRAAFASLALATPGHPILLVGTSRPGLPNDWIANVERPDNAQRVSLSRLAPKDFRELLRDAFRSERLAEELGFKILTKSDGNPLFVFEILRGLREGKYIAQSDDGSWASTQVIQDIRIPSSVMDLIHGRMAELSDEDKDLLEVASCCGFEFDPALVAEAAGVAVVPALKRFGRIEKTHRLIRSAGRHCVFDHHQVQEALYEGVLEQLREHYHAAIAAVLETREGAADVDPKELDGAIVLQLCTHYLKGARGKEALRYLAAALDHLEGGYLHDAEVDLAERALSVRRMLSGRPRMDLLLRKGRRLGELGRGTAAGAALEEAEGLAEASGDSESIARVRLALAGLAGASSSETALGILEEAAVLASSNEALKAEVDCASARVLTRMGRYDAAKARFEAARGASRVAGNPTGEAAAEDGLGNVAWRLGDFEQAAVHVARNRDLGSPSQRAAGTGSLGILAWSLGHLDEAVGHYRRARDLCRETGHRNGEATSLANLGDVYVPLGDFDESVRWSRAGLALAREIGAKSTEGWCLAHLGEVAVARGDLGEAEGRIREAVDLARSLEEVAHVVHLLLELGRILEGKGESVEAAACLDEALALAQDTRIPAQLVATSARLAATRGEVGDASELLGRHGPQLPVLSRMSTHFELWRPTGDPTHLTEAHRLLEHLRDHAPPEYRDTMVENVPLHRDIAAAWKEHGNA